MKPHAFVVSIVIVLILGCGSPAAVTPVTPVSGPIPTGRPASTPLLPPTTTIVETPIPTSGLAAASGQTVTPSLTEAIMNWNPDPNMVILSATTCCGRVSRVEQLNYIPDSRIWGDGHIIWTELRDDGARKVMEGWLTPDETEALLARFSDAGFFGWQALYADPSVADAPQQCLTIEIETQAKTVCEVYAGAPSLFHDLYRDVAAGAGALGKEYEPQTGFLTAHALQFPSTFDPPVDFEWPAAKFGLSLSEATSGVWVEGDVLREAWQVVNKHWRGSIVKDGDAYYDLSLQVPGLALEPS
jgi:hypothetical protein